MTEENSLFDVNFNFVKFHVFDQVGLHFTYYISRSVCDRILDIIPNPHGRHPGEDGTPGHLVPGAGQHLQHSDHQHTQG